MVLSPSFLALALAPLCALLLFKLLRTSLLVYPPGPPADPIIGHVRYFPKKDVQRWFHGLRDKYGNIVCLYVLGRPIIVLNSHETAVELLEKRGLNYSERARAVMIREILGFVGTFNENYNQTWARQRALITPLFTRAASKAYEPLQLRESQVMMNNLLQEPHEFVKHTRRYTTSVVLEIAYGHRVADDNDCYVALADKASEVVNNSGQLGATPPDLFPLLKHLPSWFPGAWWSRYGQENRQHSHAFINFPFHDVLKQMATSTASPSFVQRLMEALQKAGPVTERDTYDVKIAAATIHAGGSETTWSTIQVFFFVMLLYPEVQARAQKELDSIVGLATLPTFEDRPSLPFLECILQEMLRFYPTVPMGLPHQSKEDDVYNNIFIPKATIFANTYGIHRDPAVYTDAESFTPERFLPRPMGYGEPHPPATFGYGRRICPGRWMAEAAVWIVMAQTLAMFTIKRVVGADGKEIVPDDELMGGVSSAPKPFVCNIVPRSAKTAHAIEQANGSH